MTIFTRTKPDHQLQNPQPRLICARPVAYAAAAMLILLMLGACSPTQSAQQAISLPMGYVANVQFSPFYMARDRGYFEDEGFDVSFDYRWETDGIQLVAAGEIPFTVASGDQVIQARSQGLPVKAVAAWYQRFPVGVISLPSTPLDQPADLKGLRIGIPETFGASYIGLRALLDVADLTEEDIDLQAIGYTQLAALTNGTVDAVVIYANNAAAVLEEQGTAFNAVYAADYVDLVSVVIASSDTYTAENPERVASFVSAFLSGLRDVLEDPDAAFEVSRTYVEGLDENSEVQRAVLEASIDLWKSPTLGRLDAAAWEVGQDVMYDAGLIEQKSPVDELYTNDFVPEAE